MTSTNENLLESEMPDPWTGPSLMSTEEKAVWELQREQVRIRLVEAHSSSPLYQARAAKDPEYWNKFYIGQVR